MLCKKSVKGGGVFTQMPNEAKVQMIANHGIFVPYGAKVCKKHLSGKFIRDDEVINKASFPRQAHLSTKEVNELLKLLVKSISSSQKERAPVDFDSDGRTAFKYFSAKKFLSSLLGNKYVILSHASEVGFPTNHLGSRQRQDMGQGSFSLLTGGPVLLRQGEPGMSQYISN